MYKKTVIRVMWMLTVVTVMLPACNRAQAAAPPVPWKPSPTPTSTATPKPTLKPQPTATLEIPAAPTVSIGNVTASALADFEYQSIMQVVANPADLNKKGWYRISKDPPPNGAPFGPPCPQDMYSRITGHRFGGYVSWEPHSHEGVDLACYRNGRKSLLVASPSTMRVIVKAHYETTNKCNWRSDHRDPNFCWFSTGRLIVLATELGDGYTYYAVFAHLADPHDASTLRGIRHPDCRAAAPPADFVEAEVGQVLQPGDIVGWIGCTGNSVAPHLHLPLLRARTDDPTAPLEQIDPELWGLVGRW
jgi:hypothetical protein